MMRRIGDVERARILRHQTDQSLALFQARAVKRLSLQALC
jgi:hypothetical protein